MPKKHAVLKDVFGFDSFRPGQEEVVDALIGGKHVLAVMPTGSGKSLCYQVPALVREGLTIVVSPLLALMQDQVAALKLEGVAAEAINSSVPREVNVGVWQRVTRGEVDILYLTPERLMTGRMIAALQRCGVKLIAIDEAHCISQWGAAFRPDYAALQGLSEAFPGVPIGAFTATADDVTRKDIVQKLFGGQAELFVAGFDRPNISLAVEPKHNTPKQLLAFLENRKGQSGIVYALSRKSTGEWADFLTESGYRALPYHAGLSSEMREEHQNIFMAEEGVVVCATIAFGMGIDKPDVRFVFHADLPATLDAYYQEIGRAGRDGEAAAAHMVFGLEDMRMRRRFIDDEGAGDDRRRREHKRLDALLSYCESPACRRQMLLSYFGEASPACGNCDVCRNPQNTADGTAHARKIILAMQATGERFGAAHIVDLLLGKATDKIAALGHDRLPVFGSGRDLEKPAWQSLVRQLVAAQVLTLDVAGFGGLGLAPKARALLAGSETFHYRPDLVRPAKSKRKDRAAAVFVSVEHDELLKRLKALRWKLAREKNVAAYVIFSDRTLTDMASRKPLTEMDFGEIHGVGEIKRQQFARVFLKEIAHHVSQPSN